MKVGPDAARYLAAATGEPVPRPFNSRWLLPRLLKTPRAWWIVWGLSWPALGLAMFQWSRHTGHPVSVALAATGLLLALPGILGPSVSIPVQVDLPATAIAVSAALHLETDIWIIAVVLLVVGAAISEKVPVVVALMAWTWWPLLFLAVPLALDRLHRPGPDPLGPKFQAIADHPIQAALDHHAGRWRDGWLLVAPWGACVAALIDPTWPVVVALVVAYAQLFVATDTVRLVQHVAGPVVALAAAARFPEEWLLFVVVLHAAWWWRMERV